MTLCLLLLVLLKVVHSKSGLDFLVLGDWGGDSDQVPATQDELNNAQIMGQIAETYDVDFVLLVGDNFYQHGLWVDVHSKRFQTSFEDVFTAPSLRNISFYVIPGNHDYEGNITAEMFYSNISNRWVFPDRYYTLNFKIPSTNYTLDIVMTDTVQLSGPLTETVEECEAANKSLNECDLQPHSELLNGTYLGYDDKDNWKYENEWDWVRNEISSSTADYLLVSGHYPIYSCSQHGPTWSLVEELKPLLIEHSAQLSIGGHDHTMEYLEEDNTPGLGYIVSGAGKACTNSTHHLDRLPPGSLKYHSCRNGGFVRVHIENDIQAFYYLGDDNGAIDYQSTPIRPRQL